MVRCAVYSCNSNNKRKRKTSDGNVKKTSFFRFPKNPVMLDCWKSKCFRSDNFNVENARICDKHFMPDDYVQSLEHELMGYIPTRYKRIRDGAVPSLNLPGCKLPSQLRIEDARQESAKEIIIKECPDETMEPNLPCNENINEAQPECQNTVCTDKILSLELELKILRKEYEELRKTNKFLSAQNKKVNNKSALVKKEPFDEVFESLESMQEAFLLHPQY